VRFATFNLENLFARPKVFNLATWAEGEPILKAFAEFNALIERVNYTDANRSRTPRHYRTSGWRNSTHEPNE
jgi:hypothetical protein